jgi:hypothetical protein
VKSKSGSCGDEQRAFLMRPFAVALLEQMTANSPEKVVFGNLMRFSIDRLPG